jgi:hypothetical protein
LEYFTDIREILYDHLVHFVFIWYNFLRFWYHVPRKIWQTLFQSSIFFGRQ